MMLGPDVEPRRGELFFVPHPVTNVYLALTKRGEFIGHTDGASVPRLLWFALGSPFAPRLLRAAFWHDQLYTRGGTKRERWLADDLFRLDLLDAGVSRFRAQLFWAAVRVFGASNWGTT